VRRAAFEMSPEIHEVGDVTDRHQVFEMLAARGLEYERDVGRSQMHQRRRDTADGEEDVRLSRREQRCEWRVAAPQRFIDDQRVDILETVRVAAGRAVYLPQTARVILTDEVDERHVESIALQVLEQRICRGAGATPAGHLKTSND